MKIKICGITSLEDAIACARLGADLLGFNFYPPSPRYIDPQDCAPIVAAMRRQFPNVQTVGIFVNEFPATIHKTLDFCGIDMAQCSGDETPGMLLMSGPRAFKALRPSSSNDLRTAWGLYPARSNPPAFLVDAHRAGEYGGTGRTANWELAAELAARCPILLAGGLTPENAADAVRRVRPWGIDTASGVESAPGKKDAGRVEQFILNARSAVEKNL